MGPGSRFPDAPSKSRGVLRISPFTRIVGFAPPFNGPDGKAPAERSAGPEAAVCSCRTDSSASAIRCGGQLRASIGPVAVGQAIGATNAVEDLAQIHRLQPVLSQRRRQSTMSCIGGQRVRGVSRPRAPELDIVGVDGSDGDERDQQALAVRRDHPIHRLQPAQRLAYHGVARHLRGFLGVSWNGPAARLPLDDARQQPPAEILPIVRAVARRLVQAAAPAQEDLRDRLLAEPGKVVQPHMPGDLGDRLGRRLLRSIRSAGHPHRGCPCLPGRSRRSAGGWRAARSCAVRQRREGRARAAHRSTAAATTDRRAGPSCRCRHRRRPRPHPGPAPSATFLIRE